MSRGVPISHLLTPSSGHHTYSQQVNNTHPTEMLSCLSLSLLQWSEAWSDADLNANVNPSTSAKPVMPKLQNLLIALVNMDIFQMILKLSLMTVN